MQNCFKHTSFVLFICGTAYNFQSRLNFVYCDIPSVKTLFYQGTRNGQESGVEIGIDTIQFGAPASNGNENEVVPVLSEKPTDKVPEPKEQRQKQPRAGPIKAQKVSTILQVDVILEWTYCSKIQFRF